MGFSRPSLWSGVLAACVLAACGTTDVVGVVSSENAEADNPMGEPAAGTGAPAPGTGIGCAEGNAHFARALCACGSVAILGNLSSDSVSPATFASIGIAGALQATQFSGPIDGDLIVTGADPSAIIASPGHIAGALRMAGDLAVEGVLRVGSDAQLLGALSGGGLLDVQGDVHRPARLAANEDAIVQHAGQRVATETVPEPPCACGADERLAVAATVAAARHSGSASNLAPDALAQVAEDRRVVVPAGRVYLDAISVAGDLTLAVSATTTVFVGGALRVDGALRAELEDGAALELWVAGDFAVRGPIALAPRERPAAARMFVAGSWHGPRAPSGPPGLELADDLVPAAAADQLGQPDDAWVVNLYAPAVDLWLTRDAELHGALFVGSVLSVGDLRLHHDPAVLSARSDCP